MKKIKQNVIRFLRKYQMDYLDVDIDQIIDAFLSRDAARTWRAKKAPSI